MTVKEILNQLEEIMSKGSGYSNINEDLHFFLRCNATPAVPFLGFNTTKEEYLSIHKKLIEGLLTLLTSLNVNGFKELNEIICEYQGLTGYDTELMLSNRRATNLRYDNRDIMNIIFGSISRKAKESGLYANSIGAYSQLHILENLYFYMVNLQASLYFKLTDKESTSILFDTFKDNLKYGYFSEDKAESFLKYLQDKKSCKTILETTVTNVADAKTKIKIYSNSSLNDFVVEICYDSATQATQTLNHFNSMKNALNHYQRVSMVNVFNMSK